MSNKVLIFLQEVGTVPLPDALTGRIRDGISDIVSSLTENINDTITNIQGMNKYKKVVILSDSDCKRENLLQNLIKYSNLDYTIDLVIWGHGSKNKLYLHGSERLTGKTSNNNGNIRSLLTEAKPNLHNQFNLRLVYMCNCHGSSLNDDWLSIGARVSIGSDQDDNMPTPMTAFFIANWINGQKAKNAAKNAYEATIPFYLALYPPSIEPRFQNINTPYPCPTWTDPLRICHHLVQIPDIPRIITNSKILETRLITDGDRDLVF